MRRGGGGKLKFFEVVGNRWLTWDCSIACGSEEENFLALQ